MAPLRYLEDFEVGQRFELGSFSLTAEEIVAFAERYDPQSFHLESDPDGPFGGLIASGWQTGSECHVLMVEALLKDTACLGSPGVDRIRWLKPVRPDVVYTLTLTIAEVVPSRKRPDRGRVNSHLMLTDPVGAPVYTMDGITIVSRKA